MSSQWCLQKAQTEKEMTLGDALPMNRVKDTALASIEKPKNPAGAVDIKSLEVVLDKVVHLKDGKRVKDRCLREGCYRFQKMCVTTQIPGNLKLDP